MRGLVLKQQRGFTLVELVMVIVMLGVLAVVALPKLSASSAFNVRGFHDETLAYLRYAQKAAVAQRRTVCVGFTAGTLELRVAAVEQSYNCDKNLTGPRGDSPATVAAKGGVTYSSTPGDFRFDSLGQPVSATGTLLPKQALQVSDTALSISVEAVTGYVHE